MATSSGSPRVLAPAWAALLAAMWALGLVCTPARAGEPPRVEAELSSLLTYGFNPKTPHPEVFERPADAFSWTRARLSLDWQPVDWFGLEVSAEQDLAFSTFGLTSSTTLAEGLGNRDDGYGQLLISSSCGLAPCWKPFATALEYSRPDAVYVLTNGWWDWEDDAHLAARLSATRLNARFRARGASLTLGRQTIDYGGGWLWGPLDLFEPPDPRVLNRAQRYGVDAARLQTPLGGGIAAEIVGAAGRGGALNFRPPRFDLSWYGSALIGRITGQLGDFSMAAQGGKVYAGMQAGAELGLSMGPVRLRAQGTYYWSAAEDMIRKDRVAAAGGIGWKTSSGFRGSLEYFYNESVFRDHHEQRAAMVCGRINHMGEHLLGLNLDWQANAQIALGLLALVEAQTGASWIQPSLTIRASSALSLQAGAMISVGGRINIWSQPSGFDPGDDEPSIFIPNSDLGTYPSGIFIALVARDD